jgi:tRNA-Thr(GGU) m(6)t(6)A37 methyltransferase TsaA
VEGSEGTEGRLEVFTRFEEGLKDVEGFSHLFVIWLFHRSEGCELQCCPTRYGIPPPRGLFATRSPYRVNPLALTVVELLGRNGRFLRVRGVDMADRTPLLDIKPYTERDRKTDIRCGWLDSVDLRACREARSGDRGD